MLRRNSDNEAQIAFFFNKKHYEEIMHAITLWQPWATLLATGIKQYETRSWSASSKLKLPTTILIHAAARAVKKDELDTIYSNLSPEMCLSLAAIKQYPLSAIIGAVTLKESQMMTEQTIAEIFPDEKAMGLWYPSRWAWKCVNPLIFDAPIKCKGRQQFWYPNPEILADTSKAIEQKTQEENKGKL